MREIEKERERERERERGSEREREAILAPQAKHRKKGKDLKKKISKQFIGQYFHIKTIVGH